MPVPVVVQEGGYLAAVYVGAWQGSGSWAGRSASTGGAAGGSPGGAWALRLPGYVADGPLELTCCDAAGLARAVEAIEREMAGERGGRRRYRVAGALSGAPPDGGGDRRWLASDRGLTRVIDMISLVCSLVLSGLTNKTAIHQASVYATVVQFHKLYASSSYTHC